MHERPLKMSDEHIQRSVSEMKSSSPHVDHKQ